MLVKFNQDGSIDEFATNQNLFTQLIWGILQPLRAWLDQIDIDNAKVAHFLSRMIPSTCPFERDIVLFGVKIAHIPPLCQLNPLYDQLVGLRFRALCYLADQCGQDITSYW